MSEEIVLRPTVIPEQPLEVDCVRPERFAELSAQEIASLPLWVGRDQRQLGDFFDVRGERSARVRIEGDASRIDALGSAMSGGMLIVEGGVGRALGRAMRGGRIHVRGDAGDGVGSADPGASRGMMGGEIVIGGSAGAEAGAYARRGLVVVGAQAGAGAARGMIAGTVVVFGDAGSDAGSWNKRGTLIVMGMAEVGPTYRYACTYRPSFLPVMLRSLRARYQLPVDDRWITGAYHRYSGDLAELGKGEILQWVRA